MPVQKGFAPILVIILIAFAAGIGGYFVYLKSQTTPKSPTPDQTVCIQDVKLCPDGTSVGRVGPDCDFSPCPTSKESTSSADTSNWKMHTHPDMKIKFKYPSSVIIDRNDYYAIWLAKSSESQKDFRERSISINIYEQQKGEFCNSNCLEIKINNLSGKFLIYSLEGTEHINYYFPNPKKSGYILDIRYDEWDSTVSREDKELFKTIISTLESIE